MGGVALERRIGIAVIAHAEDDLGAVRMLDEHLIDGINIILQIGIE